MRGTFTVIMLLMLIGGTAAVAQTAGGTGSSGRSTAGPTSKSVTGEAPVGHRQPRAGDVPAAASDDPTRPNAEDAALDRRIKSICRGC